MTIIEFLGTWDYTLEPDEWKIAFLVLWLLFLVALFK